MGFWKNKQNTRQTPEGGYAIRLINKTGGASIKGYIVKADDTIDNAVEHIPADNPDLLGIMYDNGIADGEYVWIVIGGIADVYYSGSVTRGTFSRAAVTADGVAAGVAINEALPVPPFATDKHFQELGHPIESRVGAGLAKTIVHFN